MKKLYIIIFACLFSFNAFCQKEKSVYKYTELEVIIENVQKGYIPDKRVKVYDIEADTSQKQPTLTGITSDTMAYKELTRLAIETYGSSLINKVNLLPSKDLGDKTYGIINLSVADIREEAKFTAGMATQAILGTPIRILQKDGWYRIQTPDGYIGWSQYFNFHPMTKEEFNSWIAAKKIIFTDYFGFAYTQPDIHSQTVSDLVNSNILRYEGEQGDFYKVAYPDGRIAYILKSQSQLYDKWYSSIQLTKESIVKTAFTMMGIPYVWGGTSVKGMDCSGFTKQVLFMHGVILTRDASQQVNTGKPVDISKGYNNLQTGDLMFFGKKDEKSKKERIRHVGFYIGNNEFIHASGYIRIGSLDPKKDNYDETNTKEFIRASRVTDAIDTEGIWSISNNPFYKTITE